MAFESNPMSKDQDVVAIKNLFKAYDALIQAGDTSRVATTFTHPELLPADERAALLAEMEADDDQDEHALLRVAVKGRPS